MKETNKLQLLLDTNARLIDAIMNKSADPEGDLRDIMAETISGFGTGKHEIFHSRAEYIDRIFRPFGKQLPEESQFRFLDIQTTLIQNIGIVYGPYEISYMLDGSRKSFYMRRTVVYEWMNERWCAIHIHASDPSAHLSEGESWPVQALKAQNEQLKEQVNKQTEELSRSLSELKSAQQQLIHSAKMASLGELTAGIAHEIQNPLNFVNNFSELNRELIGELQEAADGGNQDEVKTIAAAIKENEEKINQHGRRADAIVKNMLQHSRKTTGQKEEVDLNTLVDEYLRLSYHGHRAKDKSFAAKLNLELDPSLGKINLARQDIGRVLLNLFNNAFYAMSERCRLEKNDFEPLVQVTTVRTEKGVEIKIRDNGTGIPPEVIDKIFQPFFTTKPPGQGTGLGLSLSYDIITKGHGGELDVETNVGQGTQFTVRLPGTQESLKPAQKSIN